MRIRKQLRQVAKSASLVPDPVERLRLLQQRMSSLNLPMSKRRPPGRRIGNLAAAIAAVLTLALLIWRAI